MGWTISHGTPTGDPTHRSYTGIGRVADGLAHALTARDWSRVKPVFGRRSSADPFDIPPAAAREIAVLLLRAADSGLMARDTAQAARDLAAAATRAADAGQTWKWS
ncbi:hypothetical protein [Streptomyces sp. NPDC059783]|uniref:DUF7739 domain-containing protein n=1 Tax=Streptomyces sp. NPDC059783 TaxID=3346944 RepID=UPI00364D2C9D